MSYVTIDNLQKIYQTQSDPITALDGISFEITKGTFTCILGPSGCGKTTLLRTIAGLESATAGNVIVNNKYIRKPSPEVGVVFQEHRLFPWLTVEKNVTYGLARQGVSKREQRKTSDYFLDLIGLEGMSQRLPKELSIGMSQRVGIARALATDPDILLMDEPFASVDAQTRRVLQAELLRIWEETGKTIVFVTHSVDEAILLAEQIIILSPRPTIVARDIRVDERYPRDETSAEFNAVKREILQELFV